MYVRSVIKMAILLILVPISQMEMIKTITIIKARKIIIKIKIMAKIII